MRGGGSMTLRARDPPGFRSWVTRPTTSAPADSARRPSSSSDSSTSKRRCLGSLSAASNALSLCRTPRRVTSIRSLGPSLPCDELADGLGRALDTARPIHVEPVDLGVPLEPRHLTLGVALGVSDHEPRRLGLVQPPPRHRDELPVPDPVHAR